ncbi:MAG: 3-isopropylmalate dehydratase [Nitrospinae bacterium]|nr:3-isopropylmalate dehydratase [Nitrospinota bacterium]
MQKVIEGKAYVLGNNIDTDQIIPAERLVYSLSDPEEKKNYGRYALSGVPAPAAGLPDGNHAFVKEGDRRSEYAIIVGGKNFGCGSSREHAPACLQIAGIQAVIAESYARIFYRNSVDGGFFIPLETTTPLIDEIRTGDRLSVDIGAGTVTNVSAKRQYPLKPLGDVLEILEAGTIFEYAKKAGMLPKDS